jgi:hypothetical protein
MPGPLHAITTPPILYLFAFRYKDTLTGRWIKARYRAERHEIAARYAIWEIIGEPEIRRPGGGSFNPWRSTA